MRELRRAKRQPAGEERWTSQRPPSGAGQETATALAALRAIVNLGRAGRGSRPRKKAGTRKRPWSSAVRKRPRRPITVAATSTFCGLDAREAPGTVRWRTSGPPEMTLRKLSRVVALPWLPGSGLLKLPGLAERGSRFTRDQQIPAALPGRVPIRMGGFDGMAASSVRRVRHPVERFRDTRCGEGDRPQLPEQLESARVAPIDVDELGALPPHGQEAVLGNSGVRELARHVEPLRGRLHRVVREEHQYGPPPLVALPELRHQLLDLVVGQPDGSVVEQAPAGGVAGGVHLVEVYECEVRSLAGATERDPVLDRCDHPVHDGVVVERVPRDRVDGDVPAVVVVVGAGGAGRPEVVDVAAGRADVAPGEDPPQLRLAEDRGGGDAAARGGTADRLEDELGPRAAGALTAGLGRNRVEVEGPGRAAGVLVLERSVEGESVGGVAAFRRAVDKNTSRTLTALNEPGFLARFEPVHGDSLKRVPTGYAPDHPQAELLKLKDVTFGREMSEKEALSGDLPKILADDFAIAMPVMSFLASLEIES